MHCKRYGFKYLQDARSILHMFGRSRRRILVRLGATALEQCERRSSGPGDSRPPPLKRWATLPRIRAGSRPVGISFRLRLGKCSSRFRRTVTGLAAPDSAWFRRRSRIDSTCDHWFAPDSRRRTTGNPPPSRTRHHHNCPTFRKPGRRRNRRRRNQCYRRNHRRRRPCSSLRWPRLVRSRFRRGSFLRHPHRRCHRSMMEPQVARCMSCHCLRNGRRRRLAG